MKIFKTPLAFQRWRAAQGGHVSIGFVPTMGALHAGHISLVKKSLRENKITVVSIFVNPTQFGPKEDFKKYPRPFQRDRDLLQKTGVRVLFSPSAESVYPASSRTTVRVPSLSHQLCGEIRGASHFDGVALVVTKLFNMVKPTRAYFGMKDFQQLRVIEQMNDDLNMGVRIVRCPIVREKSGLAMSSRNQYLTDVEKQVAPGFYAALLYGSKLLGSAALNPSMVSKKVIAKIHSTMPHARVEYVHVVDPETLEKKTDSRKPFLMAAALRLGQTRLIDNVYIS